MPSPLCRRQRMPALASSASQAGLDTHLFVDPTIDGEALPPGLGLAVYRITQEALTNAMRRGVSEAWVHLRRRSEGLTLEILTGAGGDAALSGAGKGMEGMQERAALYGGTLEAHALTDGSFRLLVELPEGPR